jgi:hypothetical protein
MIVDITTKNSQAGKRKGDIATQSATTSTGGLLKPHHNRLNKLSNGSQISNKMFLNMPAS